jgi:hypothetical protein
VLEEVGIQFLIIQSQVRFDVVREFDDLEVDPFFGQERFDFVEDFSVGTGVAPTVTVTFLSDEAVGWESLPQPAAKKATAIRAAAARTESFLKFFMSYTSC